MLPSVSREVDVYVHVCSLWPIIGVDRMPAVIRRNPVRTHTLSTDMFLERRAAVLLSSGRRGHM